MFVIFVCPSTQHNLLSACLYYYQPGLPPICLVVFFSFLCAPPPDELISFFSLFSHSSSFHLSAWLYQYRAGLPHMSMVEFFFFLFTQIPEHLISLSPLIHIYDSIHYSSGSICSFGVGKHMQITNIQRFNKPV